MEIRHNTSLLEQAVRQVVRQAEAPALEAEARAREQAAQAALVQGRAQAIRALSIAGALAIAAIGIAIGYKIYAETSPKRSAEIVSQPRTVTVPPPSQTSERPSSTLSVPPVPRPAPTPQQIPSAPTTVEQPARGPIVEDFNRFSRREVNLAGRQWLIVAGHYYAQETDETWRNAWCYTNPQIEGVELNINLATRESQSARPRGPVSQNRTLRQANLSQEEAVALAAACPWSDRSFAIDEIVSPDERLNPFSPTKLKTQLSNRTLRVSGAIDATFLNQIEGYRFSFDTLVIDSIGGNLDEAIRAGRWLRSNGKEVRVERMCLSACSLILAGGQVRAVGDDGVVGVHRFTTTIPTLRDGALAQEKSASITAYLRSMGVSVELFEAMASVSSEQMRYLTRNEMVRWQLVTPAELELADNNDEDAADASAPSLPPPQSRGSSTALRTLHDVDLPGGDYLVIRDTTWSDCHTECVNDLECRGYTFNGSANWCFLKSEIQTQIPFEGAISGVRGVLR